MGKTFVAHVGSLLSRWRRMAMVRCFARRDKGAPARDRLLKRNVILERGPLPALPEEACYCFTCNLLVNLLSNAAIQGRTHALVF
jgi:hypothetical protein